MQREARGDEIRRHGERRAVDALGLRLPAERLERAPRHCERQRSGLGVHGGARQGRRGGGAAAVERDLGEQRERGRRLGRAMAASRASRSATTVRPSTSSQAAAAASAVAAAPGSARPIASSLRAASATGALLQSDGGRGSRDSGDRA